MSANAIRKLISTWGCRLARQTCRSHLTTEHDVYRVIQSFKFEEDNYADQHLEKKKSYKIAFIIPEMKTFAGGLTSVLRLGTYLTEFGHRVDYVDISGRPIERLAQNARGNLPNYRGRLVPKEALDDEYDIGIATSWITAYYLYGRDNFSYKCYFIQDFEPAFYPLGDLYYLALNTYKFNFRMISLGSWNAAKIREHVGQAKISVIDFPIEAQQFPIKERTVLVTNRLKVLAYVKMDRKRAPTLIFQSLDLLTRTLADRKINVEVLVFGLDPRDEIPIGENLGYVPHDELLRHYQSCDLGVVASYSNISLITCEMIASGLPVVEFKDGSSFTFFDETQLVFCETSPADFVDQVLYYLDHQEELETMLNRAQESLRGKTWPASARSFVAAMIGTEDEPGGEG